VGNRDLKRAELLSKTQFGDIRIVNAKRKGAGFYPAPLSTERLSN
jgi:hypothetical protein